MLDEREPRTIESVEKTFDVVESLKNRGRASLADIAEDTGLPKSTVHIHVSTLRQRGFAVFEDGTYRLGSEFLNVGLRFQEGQRIFKEAKGKVDELARETGEAAACFSEEQGYVVYLYATSGENAVKILRGPDIKVGYRRHMHVSASGKSILAQLPEHRLDDVIQQHGLPPKTPNTITEPAELMRELETIRNRGFAFSIEEAEIGRNSVGAAIQNDRGDVLGAIGVTGPANRVKGDRLEDELPELILGYTNEIELNLKYA